MSTTFSAPDGARSTRAVDSRMVRAYGLHRDRLRAVALSAGIGSGEAEDVVQEAFLVLARKIDDVPVRAERSFLVSSALKLASDRRRSAWHRVVSTASSEEDFEPSRAETPEQWCVRRESDTLVEALLEHMPDDERSAFLLVESEGLSRSEVASILCVPEGTVASRLSRARKRCDKALRNNSDRALRTSLLRPSPYMRQTVGGWRMLTNPWGADKTNARFEQRFLQRHTDGQLEHGWYWHFCDLDRTVLSFPEVYIGWKPWEGGGPTDTRFPLRVDRSGELVVDYAVETAATGSHNLIVSTWLLPAPTWSICPDPAGVTTEIAVWQDYSSGARPRGHRLDPLTVGGETYEVWVSPDYGRPYRDPGWRLFDLYGPGGSRKGPLLLGEILLSLARRGAVRMDEYVSCVELGNEIMGGAGSTFIKRFGVAK